MTFVLVQNILIFMQFFQKIFSTSSVKILSGGVCDSGNSKIVPGHSVDLQHSQSSEPNSFCPLLQVDLGGDGGCCWALAMIASPSAHPGKWSPLYHIYKSSAQFRKWLLNPGSERGKNPMLIPVPIPVPLQWPTIYEFPCIVMRWLAHEADTRWMPLYLSDHTASCSSVNTRGHWPPQKGTRKW